MYQLTVIAHSASKKSILASVAKTSGMFTGAGLVGNIKIDNAELPAIGTKHELNGITKVTLQQSISEENGKEFNWLVLE